MYMRDVKWGSFGVVRDFEGRNGWDFLFERRMSKRVSVGLLY
jgi:hypothetical protein